MGNEMQNRREDRSGLLVTGFILIGAGLLFLMVNLDILPSLSKIWPLFIVIFGLALIIGGLFRQKSRGN
jgi:hypothetical protein